MAELPGKDLAQELINQSRAQSRKTPMEAVIRAVQEGSFDTEQAFRLIGRLWTFERMLYYIYGGWGQGLEVNDFPPSVKYFFSRQIVDDSTHEMLYMDAMLRHGWIATQKAAFQHLYGRFVLDSGLAYYVFALRNFATYPHNVRIAALNLGPKILELGWMEGLAAALGDGELQRVFTSQFVENRSHINMGRRVVEECVRTPVQAEMCRWACNVATRDYQRCLQELSDVVLDRASVSATAAPAPVIE